MDDDVDADHLDRTEARAVLAALKSLPSLQRRFVVAAHYRSMTCEAIATATGTEPAHVRRGLHEALHALCDALDMGPHGGTR